MNDAMILKSGILTILISARSYLRFNRKLERKSIFKHAIVLLIYFTYLYRIKGTCICRYRRRCNDWSGGRSCRRQASRGSGGNCSRILRKKRYGNITNEKIVERDTKKVKKNDFLEVISIDIFEMLYRKFTYGNWLFEFI